MNTKLLNFLAQNFKEKRLIFGHTGGDEAPDASVEDSDAQESRPVNQTDAGPEDTEVPAADARATAATDASEGLDEDPEGVTIPDQEPEFKTHPPFSDLYSGDPAEPKKGDFLKKEGDQGTRFEAYNGKEWIPIPSDKIPPGWAQVAPVAPAAAAPDAAAEQAARELEAAKGRLTAAKEKVAEEKAKVTQDILRTKVKEQLGNGDDQLKDELAKIIIPDEFDAEIEANFKEVTDKLTEADSLTEPTEIDQKIQEAETALRELTPGKYIEARSEGINKHKPLLALFDQLKAIGKEGTHAKAVLDEIRTAIIADLGTETDPATIPDKIKSDFSEKLAIAFVADTIEVTPEDFQAAIRFYKLGQYRVLNETHPKFQKNKEILDKFVAAKKEGKLNGITFDFFGSTNNVDHRLTKDKAWHQEKAAALTKILELNTAGRLQVDPAITQFITDNKALIDQYTAAVAAGAGYVELVTANKDKFLKGGTIFDLALRLQRAAEFKRLVEDKLEPTEGEKYTDIFTADGTDKVELLHQDNNSDDAMSSGIKAGLAESIFTPPAAPNAQGGGTPADAPAGTPADADPNAATDAPEVQTNTDDHAYFIEPDGRLKVTFKGEDEAKYYTIVKPANVTLTPSKNEDDQYVTFKVGDDPGAWIEFDEGKVFKSDDFENNVSNTYTATLDDSNKTITITATPVAPTAAPAEGTTETPQQKATKLVDEAIRLNKEAQTKTGQEKSALEIQAAEKLREAIGLDPQGGHQERFNNETMPDTAAAAPGGASEALQQKDRETTKALRTKLTEAKTEIDNLITKFEGTIGTNTGLEAAVATEVATKKAQMEATFEQVRGRLQDALDKTASGDFLGAEAAYKEAEKIITDTLNEEMKPNFREAFLSTESTAAIAELRAAVTKHKPLVEAAFAEKLAAVQALEPAPAAAE